jgi:outer membrane lipoprotein-sorting protein
MYYPASNSWAQEEVKSTKPVVAEAAPESKPAALPNQNKQPKKKVVLRRNEASGAAALITMEQARDKLIRYKSVKADISEVVTLGNRKIRLSGKYLQGTDLQLRFEFEVNVGGTKGRLLEVCDGQILWTYYEVGKQKRVARRLVRQILNEAGDGPENLLIAEIGLGGLPGLLASIQRAIVFDKQWEQDVGDQTFVVVEGTWTPSNRAKFLGGKPNATDPLPAHVPDRVRIYYDKKHLFPRRVLYLKRDLKTRVHHPMVKLDFLNVEWNIELDKSQFNYTPPENVPREDTTEHYVKQFVEARKKAEEEKNGKKK